MEIKDFLKPVADKEKAGWQHASTDKKGRRRKLSSSAINSTNTRMGVEVAYGQRPEGYDGWVIREPNGGGSVTVPYIWIDGELYLGAIRQERKAMGGLSTEASRGFSLPTESHLETAQREFAQETGAHESLSSRIKPLGKKGVNPNSAFFLANTKKGEGVKFFGLEMNPEEVVIKRNSEDPQRRVYKFTPELQGEIKELNEKIKPEGIRFFHVGLLSQTADGFTLEAIARIQNAPRPQVR